MVARRDFTYEVPGRRHPSIDLRQSILMRARACDSYPGFELRLSPLRPAPEGEMSMKEIRVGDVVRARYIRSPSMLVIKLHLQNDDSEVAELLWFDANMNARQIALNTSLIEHVPSTPNQAF